MNADAAEEWGLPNWKDASSYGDTSSWQHMRWRWEFYRRRDDLREYFDANAEQTYKACVKQYSDPKHIELFGESRILKPSQPGFKARVDVQTAEKFGYTGIPNPRISQQTSHVMFSAMDYPGDVSLYAGETCKDVDGNPAPIQIEDHKIAIVFNLDKPISDQIKAAKESLQGYQSERHGTKLQKRQRTDLWLTYLRVLDGKECGASWSEISKILIHTAGTSQTARDAWEQASALRFNF